MDWLGLATTYVLIRTEPGKERKLAQELRKVKGVSELYFLYGIFDILVRVDAGSLVELKALITWHIRRLEQVRSTLTLIVADPQVPLQRLQTAALTP